MLKLSRPGWAEYNEWTSHPLSPFLLPSIFPIGILFLQWVDFFGISVYCNRFSSALSSKRLTFVMDSWFDSHKGLPAPLEYLIFEVCILPLESSSHIHKVWFACQKNHSFERDKLSSKLKFEEKSMEGTGRQSRGIFLETWEIQCHRGARRMTSVQVSELSLTFFFTSTWKRKIGFWSVLL